MTQPSRQFPLTPTRHINPTPSLPFIFHAANVPPLPPIRFEPYDPARFHSGAGGSYNKGSSLEDVEMKDSPAKPLPPNHEEAKGDPVDIKVEDIKLEPGEETVHKDPVDTPTRVMAKGALKRVNNKRRKNQQSNLRRTTVESQDESVSMLQKG